MKDWIDLVEIRNSLINSYCKNNNIARYTLLPNTSFLDSLYKVIKHHRNNTGNYPNSILINKYEMINLLNELDNIQLLISLDIFSIKDYISITLREDINILIEEDIF